MLDSKRGFLPMAHGISLYKNQCPKTQDERERMQKILYASAMGFIMYAMLCTQPDVSCALSLTSRYQSDPSAMSWKSSKQVTVADSTTEVEYIVALDATKEVVWIKKFIRDLRVVPSIANFVALYCDKNGAIVQAKEPRSHQRILRLYHLIMKLLKEGM
ncbi:retrotransposon protein, putative, Ty1-copia subclass [Cucumis melo var. makuwa]|uniref:Retrotransposon protein, putative, Ty1-copia subclass n=1 Tax=Cucumis melo var. makuwa TaxID=1194695 RepID=A0A5A7SKS3_CUCMM|nr:retrotransposon protein, putative, Ty1-copia subclass [Cucumis melo var. makuwa]TYK21497.1 retrotransposon protein, putative, Ty1-copia subclass [Cucumis melo var. makuwa]